MGPPRPSGRVGDVLGGKYKVERILGSGGVGVIVAATHLELGQRVAIKMLRADVDKELKERFLREARAAVRLHGEHVARVTDVGRTDDGTPYFVMEFLAGEDLGHALERGPMPIETAVELALQVCEGLAEAHAAGIVHRDLKPRNLFLTKRLHGELLVKLLDFGIAKVHGKTDGKDTTGTETVFGSPQYMSPEQMRASRDVDVRSDIWSLGVCLYELLAGTAPFDAPTVPLLCVKVLTEPPPPLRERRPDVPDELWQVIARCLAKDREQRYANVAELAAALEAFAPGARGASLRVLAVLDAPPRSVPPPAAPDQPPDVFGDTRTAGSFDTAGERSHGRRPIFAAIAAAVGVFAIAAVTIGAVALHKGGAPAPSDTSVARPELPVTPIAPVTEARDAATLAPAETIDLTDKRTPAGMTSAAPTARSVTTARPPRTKKGDGGVNPSGVF